MSLHLIKLCVGCETVEELIEWRRQTRQLEVPWILRTRQTPKRAPELVGEGSLYRVYKGFILSRQRILAIDTVDTGPQRRCEIELEETVFFTTPTPRRAFQGWRYLDPLDAPGDLRESGQAGRMPADLVRRLREIGAW